MASYCEVQYSRLIGIDRAPQEKPEDALTRRLEARLNSRDHVEQYHAVRAIAARRRAHFIPKLLTIAKFNDEGDPDGGLARAAALAVSRISRDEPELIELARVWLLSEDNWRRRCAFGIFESCSTLPPDVAVMLLNAACADQSSIARVDAAFALNTHGYLDRESAESVLRSAMQSNEISDEERKRSEWLLSIRDPD